MSLTLRDYQETISTDAAKMLEWLKIVYLAMQVRTGKSATALATCEKFGAKNVLFITKKKAKSSIKNDDDVSGDYDKMNPSFKLHLINYEQIHNLSPDYKFDVVILDEAHCLGQFAKPSERTKLLKQLCTGKPIIYLSGTPTPESFSQIYHQFWVSSFSPFKQYKNFYQWAKDYVTVKKKYYYNREINDYSNANKEKVDAMTKHLFISWTQEQAGFTAHVKEEIIKIPMQSCTYSLAKILKTKKVYIGKGGEEILADTAVKLMGKLHQIYTGSVLAEDKTFVIFDNSKVNFIKEHFKGQKIAVFYKFRAEGEMLTTAFGESITTDPQEFNESTDKTFISQIQSGREGINLSTADCLIMLNIDFSSVSYQQAKARIQTKDRTKDALLYWIFAIGGIEEKIYEVVQSKQDFTIAHFKQYYNGRIDDTIERYKSA